MNEKHLRKIVQAFFTMPFTLPICCQILTLIKAKLEEIGFKSFPVVTFAGPGHSGKSVIVSACLYEDSQECRG